MLLTTEEVMELTGRIRPSAQRKWLDRNGYKYEVGADNRPKVLKSHVERRLGGEIRPQLRLTG